MDNPAILTAAAAASYDLTELKAHIRVTGTDDDTILGRLAVLATERLQQYLSRVFVNESYTWTLDSFGQSRDELDDFWFSQSPIGTPSPQIIDLPFAPLVTVDEIRYLDTSETQITLASSAYRVDTSRGRLSPSTAQSFWPATAALTGAVEIDFTAGYGAGHANVPARLKQGIYTLTGHYYENRESTAAFSLSDVELNSLVDLNDFKRWRF